MMQDKKSLTGAYAFVQGSFWMSYCTAVSFASVYLLALGCSNFTLGMVMAVGNLLGAFLGTCLSARIDRSERISAARLIPPVLALQAAAALALLLHPVKDSLMICVYTLYITFTIAGNSLNLKLYADALHHGREIDYGSAAYVLLSMLLGVVIERFSIRCVPLSALVMCLLQFLAFRLMTRDLPSGSASPGETAGRGVSLSQFVRENRAFSVMLIGIALLFFGHNMVVNFLINITRNVGGDTSTMGFINAFMAAVEIPVMMLYHRLFGKKKPASMLRIAFLFFAVKGFAIALSRSIFTLSAAFLLQAPSFALQAAAIVPYVDQAIRYEDSAKAQSLAFTMTTIGAVLASVIGGLLYDRAGVNATLWVSCAVCCAGTAVSLLGLGTHLSCNPSPNRSCHNRQ